MGKRDDKNNVRKEERTNGGEQKENGQRERMKMKEREIDFKKRKGKGQR